MDKKEVEIAGKLIPVLREGVEMLKMILFMKLKEYLSQSRSHWQNEYRNKIIGAVLNDIFGMAPAGMAFSEFAKANKETINDVIGEMPIASKDLLAPLTDALRIMVLCDHQEGADHSMILQNAQDKGVLLADRDLPMPHTFIELIRRIGSSYGLLIPPSSSEK